MRFQIKAKAAVAFLFLWAFSACEKEPLKPAVNQLQFRADERLWIYFQRFEEEAGLRGMNVNLNDHDIRGFIDKIPEEGVAGVCQYGYRISNDVTIDENYWNRSRDLDREFVVFHELGHCFLERAHLEDSFRNGICVSIMRSGLGNCIDAYNFQNRAYYLDELFSIVGN